MGVIRFFKKEDTMGSISQILHDKLIDVFEQFTQAIKSIDIDHAYIHDGITFAAFDKAVVTTGSTVQYAFKTPATGYVHYRLAGINPSADKLDTQIFKDAVYTDATGIALSINNKNQNSVNVSSVVLIKNPTFTSDGTLLPGFSSYLPGSTGAGQARVGTSAQSDSEIVLEQDTVYRFVATNGSSQTNTIGINFRWYEQESGE